MGSHENARAQKLFFGQVQRAGVENEFFRGKHFQKQVDQKLVFSVHFQPVAHQHAVAFFRDRENLFRRNRDEAVALALATALCRLAQLSKNAFAHELHESVTKSWVKNAVAVKNKWLCSSTLESSCCARLSRAFWRTACAFRPCSGFCS